MKKITIFVLLLLPIGLKAQQVNVDSLVYVLDTQRQELTSEKRMQLYWDILLCYWSTDLDKNILYAKEAIQFAEKNNNYPWAARFHRAICISYYRKDQFDQALEAAEKAVKYAVKAGNKKEENAAYLEIANTYMTAGNREMALKTYIDILPALESAQQYDLQAYVLINIANLHYNNDGRALNYLKQARAIAEKHDLIGPMMSVYSSIGGIYNERGQQDSALISILKSYEISKEINDKGEIIISTQMLAGLYGDLNDLENAEKFADECLENAVLYGDEQKLRVAWIVKAKANMDMKRYKEAETYAYKAWVSDSTDLQQAGNSSILLCQSNIFSGNHEKADYFLRQYKSIRDQLSDESLQNNLADMEVKYETEKKEMRISALEKEKILYTWLGIVIAVASLSIIGLLFYRHRLAIQNRKNAEQQIQQLKQEKELIAIQSSLKAEKAERDLIAHDLHDSVSSLLTVVKNNMNLYSASEHKETKYFNNAFEVLSKSITELRRVVYHLKSFILTKEGPAAALDDFCRFIPDTGFHFKGINRRFDPDKEYVLYDCACELINNALKHSGASHIDVHLNMDEQMVYLSVADNGTGFDSREVKPGIGLDNIRSNLTAFGGHLDILSEPGKGTEANIEMEI